MDIELHVHPPLRQPVVMNIPSLWVCKKFMREAVYHPTPTLPLPLKGEKEGASVQGEGEKG